MAQKIQLRHDTAANWTSANPTLMVGEFGYETDTSKIKIGDGTTAWASLTYLPLYASSLSGAVAIANGGTGQTAKTAAFDALSPNSTLGDVAYHNGTNNVRLAGNTTSTKKYLGQTGTGSVSAAPAWTQPAFSELSGNIAVSQMNSGTSASSSTFWRGDGTWSQTGGGGGGSLQWIEDTDAPTSSIENHDRVYLFGSALSQSLYARIKVPSGYTTGSPIKLKTVCYSPDSSGNMLVQTIATLIRTGTDAVSSTTNQRTSTNTTITLGAGTVNIPQALSLDLSDSTGKINSVSVSPGDLILIQLTRGTDTGASDVRVPVFDAEVTVL